MKRVVAASPKAIQTEYKGLTLKSRLEAQCAYLLDALGWQWEYEPYSYMLPNGVSYTPDFLVEDHQLVIECRGYDSDKGCLQLDGFAELIKTGLHVKNEDEEPIDRFLVLFGDKQPILYQRLIVRIRESEPIHSSLRHSGVVVVLHCKNCGWRLAPVSYPEVYGSSITEAFCDSCIAPLSLNVWKKWDGKAVIDSAAVVTVEEGKILVNGKGVESFNG